MVWGACNKGKKGGAGNKTRMAAASDEERWALDL